MKKITLLVLAGGFGTRLRSVVSEVPKPLAPVGDKSFLHYLVESWVEQGITRLIFLLHYQAGMIEEALLLQKREGRLKGCELHTLSEPKPMGTGGAIAHAVRELGLNDWFLVANADTWLGSGIEAVDKSAAPAMAVVRVPNSERYGSVRMNQNKVTGFEEKSDVSGPGWINAGLYKLNPALFQDWNNQPFSIERQLFPDLAMKGCLNAVALDTEFIDIGVPEDYFRFVRWINENRAVAL